MSDENARSHANLLAHLKQGEERIGRAYVTAATQRVHDLHERRDGSDGTAYCDLCAGHGDITWPCATIRALDTTEK